MQISSVITSRDNCQKMSYMKSKSNGDIEAEAELLNMIGTLDMVSTTTNDNCAHTTYTRQIPYVANDFDSRILLYTERRC